MLSGTSAGAVGVSGASWNFDADVVVGSGPWTSVIATNLSCERPLPIPGTAQAGAVVFTAQLNPTPNSSGLSTYQGDLLPFRGSAATGYVLLVGPQSPGGATHIDAGIFGLEGFTSGTTLNVCLIAEEGTPIGMGSAPTATALVLAGMGRVLGMGYEVTGAVTTQAPNGTLFIGISGAKLGTADGANQWVFFFNGSTYLGTDTAVPSSYLSLAGSPAPGQIDVRYVAYAAGDPLCCPTLPPVVITYTWNGSSVTPNGTPPGH